VKVKLSSASIQPKSARWPALLTAIVFNWMGPHANSCGNRVYCYAELAIFSQRWP